MSVSPHYAGVGRRSVYTEIDGSYPLGDRLDLFAHAGTATARALAVVYQLLEVAPAATAGAGAPLAMSSPVEGTWPT